ncbi:Eco57I restriction-modification methylase domain-containing protein [Embleya sp. MST-111070]|uniref:Eco57I restriction-modification methylase domain-containing protein n=1 Tax=Embleya sp. MST-111070 TaxID=3398231 RepID=UPI003F740881
MQREVGSAAVSWAHGMAWAMHAVEYGLVDTPSPRCPDDTRRVLESLALAHPALEMLADGQVVDVWDTFPSQSTWLAATDFWRSHPAVDGPHRVDGFELGNAYQALSDEARKGRALCQTPPWIAQLLLDLALQPATRDVGPAEVRMIDPSCGTGHILVTAFHSARVYRPPGRGPSGWPSTEGALERALRTVHGVDLDPYAVALSRYRLLATTAAILRGRIDAVPTAWPIQVVAGDSLLGAGIPLLERGQYHAVVGNPPYIIASDPKVRARIRAAYPRVAHGKFSLALPFCQLMFELAVPGGRIAQLTANSFMKREFGRRFVEEYLPDFDMRMVIDTSGAYIPGHGTPTVILLHRNRPPQDDRVFTVLGVRGEPNIPEDPSRGRVWTAIEEAVRSRIALDEFHEGLRAHVRASNENHDVV